MERERFPRDLPGETLHPGVEPLLRQLGVLEPVLAARFLRHEGHWVLWDRDRGAPLRWVPFGKDGEAGPPWRGFQAWRADFDSLLLRRARALGATVYQPCKAAEPLRGEGGRITGVVTSSALQLRARFVVDAAGGRHWIARRLGLPVEYHSPRLVARYGYAEGECPARDEAPALVADRHGWTWAARVRPGRYAWTRLPLRCATGNDTRLPPEELRGDGLGPWGRTRGADVTWRTVVPAARAGYFLVGDAAAVVDPASSHGVLRALMSGVMAAHLITRVIRHGENETLAARGYSDWIYRWFARDVAHLRDLYARLPEPPGWLLR